MSESEPQLPPNQERWLEEAFDDFAQFLYAKADNFPATEQCDHDFALGMKNAAADAELYLGVIRGNWRAIVKK